MNDIIVTVNNFATVGESRISFIGEYAGHIYQEDNIAYIYFKYSCNPRWTRLPRICVLFGLPVTTFPLPCEFRPTLICKGECSRLATIFLSSFILLVKGGAIDIDFSTIKSDMVLGREKERKIPRHLSKYAVFHRTLRGKSLIKYMLAAGLRRNSQPAY